MRGFTFTLEALIALLVMLVVTTTLFVSSDVPLKSSDLQAAIDSSRVIAELSKSQLLEMELESEVELLKFETGKCMEAQIDGESFGNCNFERGVLIAKRVYFDGEFHVVQVKTG